jgi:hypothetical protein
MHRHPLYKVCNRDVKASNVLIMTFEPGADGNSRPTVKVTDFGFANRDRRKTVLGTMGCMAPEIFFRPCAPIQTLCRVPPAKLPGVHARLTGTARAQLPRKHVPKLQMRPNATT